MASPGDDVTTDGERVPEDPRAAALSGVRKHVHAALFGGAAPADVGRDGLPESVGRFRITKRLGSGGMGEVLAGFDDELERAVAVKLLHTDIGQEHAERLRREAKALAQLSHPNVVQVYEVGSWRNQLFIAMELVEGQTLKEWLAVQPQSLDAILQMFISAGAGLAAAHARELIHRDFKPENMIVADDGRPRILDFGLARKDSNESASSTEHEAALDDLALVDTHVAGASGKLGDSLTQTGAILGTPAYMPPEQLRGMATNAASDQFSFCVALWEAVYRERPFAGKNVRELAVAVCDGDIREPEEPRGPARLRRAMARGLAVDPKERWPGMEALLDELDSIRTAPARRTRAAVAIGSLGIAAAAAAWGVMQSPGDPVVVADDRCRPAQERIAGIWDDETRLQFAAKYQASTLGAQQWWRTEENVLDTWVADWSRIYTAACASDERERAPLLFEQRQTCLDQRWNEIKIRVTLLEELDPAAQASAASGDYLPFYLPRECEDDKLVGTTVAYPADAAKRGEVLETYREMRIADAWARAAFFGDPNLDYKNVATERFERNRPRLVATGFAPIVAEQTVRLGNGYLVGHLDEKLGFAAIEEASRLAQDARIELIYVLAELWRLEQLAVRGGSELAQPETLEDFARWEAALQRVGAPASGMLELQDLRAQHYGLTGDAEAAKAEIERSVDLGRKAYGTDTPFMVRVLGDAALAASRAGLTDQRRRLRAEAVEISERIYGPNPLQLQQLFQAQSDEALAEHRLGDALGPSERALAIAVAHHGDAGMAVLVSKLQLASVSLARGDYAAVESTLDAVWRGKTLDALFLTMSVELQAAFAAVRGTTDAQAMERLSTAQTESAFSRTMVALTTPLVDDRPVERALADVNAALEGVELPLLRATGALVRGHLLERDGQHSAAAASYEEAWSCGCGGGLANGLIYASGVGAVRTLRKASDPRADEVAAEVRKRLADALPTHPLLAEL